MAKLKMKTKKSAKKRFKITGSGKIMKNHSGRHHFNEKKRNNRKRHLRHKGLVSDADKKRIKRMLGI
ncbi:MAG TPA: 50S ribosomal protein L35 [Thermotogaceae bacterium]|nr:50S ribosomal protein L35 [Thermotogaceae bacterium]